MFLLFVLLIAFFSQRGIEIQPYLSGFSESIETPYVNQDSLADLPAENSRIKQDPTGITNSLSNASGTMDALIVDGVKFECSGEGILRAIAALPSTGGVITLACSKTIQLDSTISIRKPLFLELGASTVRGPLTGYIFDIEAAGVHIEGLSSGFRGGEVRSSQLISMSNNHAVYIGRAIIDWKIAHVQINDGYGIKRSVGAGIFADAGPSPANNQLGFIEDVVVYQMFEGVNLQRPMNTSLKDFRADSSRQDGLVITGDGTTVSCINCYLNNNAGRGVNITWMNGVTFVGGEISGNGGVGLTADSNGTNVSSNLNIVGTDFESNAGGGVLTQDAVFVTLTSSNFLGNGGDGIAFRGGNGFLVNAFVRNSDGFGLNLGGTSRLGFQAGDAALISTTNWSGNSLGDSNDPNRVLTRILSSEVTSRAFSSNGDDTAQSGVLRLAPGEGICWRGSINRSDNCISEDDTDHFSGNNIPITTTFVTTSATAEEVTVKGMTSRGHCSLTALNESAAANIATTYVSEKITDRVKVTHVAKSTMAYDILCTPN